MPAYFVAVRNAVTDAEQLKIYGDKTLPTFAGHAMKPLAVYGKTRSTDGKPTDSAVVLEFPTFEEAEAWYDSPAYQAIVEHRFKGGDYQTFIVHGV